MMKEITFIIIVVFIIFISCSRNNKTFIINQPNFTHAMVDTIVNTGATHNTNTYTENEHLIMSISFLEDSNVFCKITQKTEGDIIDKPLYVPSATTKIHLTNPNNRKYISEGSNHGYSYKGKLDRGETIEGIYDLNFDFQKIGVILYPNNDFFMLDGNYQIQLEVLYFADGESRSLITPPLIYHHTVNQEVKKGIDDLIKKYGQPDK